MSDIYDLLIVGGGVNGTAIARDAAGRGLSVMLCEMDDLASHTSSASTKLIHGGLRYLEYYEFRLVHEALKEREVLLRSAPHIIWPLRFILPYDAGLRPAWMLRLGLFLYDSLGGRKKLPGTRRVDLTQKPYTDILEPRLKRGFEYSDCWVEDARLVALYAMDARARGADVLTQTKVTNIAPASFGYEVSLKTAGKTQTVTARGVVNAAGPWVDEMLDPLEPPDHQNSLRLVKGSHIVTHRLFRGDDAYIFQNRDNRIIFAIPYERDFTLIGTTDVPYSFTDGPVKISKDEIDYLCAAANEYLKHDISPKDVKWSYAGVRPLYDDHAKNASAVTRDYVLKVKEYAPGFPLLSVYGGKITTSRKLAEHALEQLSDYYKNMGDDWTEDAVLPGGDIPSDDFDAFFEDLSHEYPWLKAGTLWRLARDYGTCISQVIGRAKNWQQLGQDFGCGLTEAEISYLIANEFAASADDVLWRRTKLGLHMTKAQIKGVERWFKAQA